MAEIKHRQNEPNLCAGSLSIQDFLSMGQGLVWGLGLMFTCTQDFLAIYNG